MPAGGPIECWLRASEKTWKSFLAFPCEPISPGAGLDLLPGAPGDLRPTGAL